MYVSDSLSHLHNLFGLALYLSFFRTFYVSPLNRGQERQTEARAEQLAKLLAVHGETRGKASDMVDLEVKLEQFETTSSAGGSHY